VELLEREAELRACEEAVADAARGEGRVVLVSGEAGIGKTTLTRELARRVADRARVLVGACDDLLTPRTLGPFRDLRLGPESPLRRVLDGGADRDVVLAAVLEECNDPLRPTLVVVEDAHWADEATRDVLAFLGRRIAGMPAVLVVTYRDELPSGHPLRPVLGRLAGPWVRRLPLAPLSDGALSSLAATAAIDTGQLRRLTGGNPFLVAEVLSSSDPSTVPLTVRDAVAARLQPLTASTRDVLVLLAVAPGGLELEVLHATVPTALQELAIAEELGFVEVVGGRVRYRHDLLRGAVAAAVPATTLGHAHARILAALEEGTPEPSRAVHHAIGAGDVAATIRHAPAAARRAMEVASHRDAVAILEAVLRHEPQLAVDQLTDLLRWYAFELYLADRHRDAMRAARRAVGLLDAGPTAPERGEVLGKALTLLSHTACWAAEPEVSIEAGERALAVLAAAPSTPVRDEAQAIAYANRAFGLAMLGHFDRSREAAGRAVELASPPSLRHVRPYALIQFGGATSLAGDEGGDGFLEEGIALAQEVDRHEYVALGCTWRSISAIRHGRPDEVERWATFGIRWSEDHQLDIGMTTLRMLLAELQLRRGDVADAEPALRELARDADATAWGHTVACTLLGRLLARRGDDDDAAFELLSRGWRLALQSREPERLARAGAGWFEWAVLHDDPQAQAWGEEAIEVTRHAGNPWLFGELVRLRAERVGPATALHGIGPDEVAAPWREALLGDPHRAADAWDTLGWPYERARELAASAEVPSMIEALHLYDRLGTARSAAQLRQRLRAHGVQRVPRGPARETLANPAGLTARQLEVLSLLVRGLTNPQIADELVLSTRTVDHHVSAVLGKLGVSSRADAADAAALLGIDPVPR
jgi:ATP/maltotriose-dependent transcriptional regulator MalT